MLTLPAKPTTCTSYLAGYAIPLHMLPDWIICASVPVSDSVLDLLVAQAMSFLCLIVQV